MMRCRFQFIIGLILVGLCSRFFDQDPHHPNCFQYTCNTADRIVAQEFLIVFRAHRCMFSFVIMPRGDEGDDSWRGGQSSRPTVAGVPLRSKLLSVRSVLVIITAILSISFIYALYSVHSVAASIEAVQKPVQQFAGEVSEDIKRLPRVFPGQLNSSFKPTKIPTSLIKKPINSSRLDIKPMKAVRNQPPTTVAIRVGAAHAKPTSPPDPPRRTPSKRLDSTHLKAARSSLEATPTTASISVGDSNPKPLRQRTPADNPKPVLFQSRNNGIVPAVLVVGGTGKSELVCN
jgi:hypothetical protein